MERRELEYVLAVNGYIEGGTKEACVKVKAFLRDSHQLESLEEPPFSSVKKAEFIDALKTLLAFSFMQDDTIPETWHCDSDCRMWCSLFCRGECNIRKDSDRMCPYFVDEGNI